MHRVGREGVGGWFHSHVLLFLTREAERLNASTRTPTEAQLLDFLFIVFFIIFFIIT